MTAAASRHPLGLAATSFSGAHPVAFIDAAARAGFDAIGLRLYLSPGQRNPFDPVIGNEPLIRDIRLALDRTGLAFWDIFSFYLKPDTDVESMVPAFALGASLGARYALVLANDPDWQRMTDNLAAVCAAAGRFGLTVALEAPHLRLVLKTLPDTLKLIADSGASNAVVLLDTNQFALAGHSADLLRGQEQRLFPYAQLTDSRPGEDKTCGPSEGAAPNREILAALPAGLPLSVEWPPPPDSSFTVDEWAARTYRQTAAFLGQQPRTSVRSGGSAVTRTAEPPTGTAGYRSPVLPARPA